MKIMMIVCMVYLVSVAYGICDMCCPSCSTHNGWTLSGSTSLNYFPENNLDSIQTFGLKSGDSTYSGTNCDFLVGVFTAGGSFGCVIHGIGSDELKYCDSYPDVPVYAFVWDERRFGTFVAVEEGCTDGLKINRVYMKNTNGEKYWGYDNKWIDSDGHTEGKFSLWQVESTADTGYYLENSWYYKQPEYEWHTEDMPDCPQVCNYPGGYVDRLVVCRRERPSIHDYISYDGSECAGLTMPNRIEVCPAFACQWIQIFTNWNCMGAGSSVSNQLTTGVTSSTQCQSDCANYSYGAWWDQTEMCRCYHVCSSSTGGATSGGVQTNTVWEQIAATGRRTN